MNPVEEEHQARRAEDRARYHIDNSNHHHYHYPLLQNIPSAPIWNRGRGGRHHLPLSHIIPNNLPYHPSLQNIPPAPVWNRGRGRKCYITPLYVPANLDEAIVDLHR